MSVGNAREVSFFELVRRLTREREGAVSPGGAGPASRENVRFRPAASLGFAATDVEEVAPSADGSGRHRITVNFMGLYGPASPLPNHFTEDILWAGSDEGAVRDFLDLFHHRIISLVYRAWEKYRYPEQFSAEAPDAVTRRMLCLLGLGTAGMGEAAGLALAPLLSTAGALASRRRSAVGLECFLATHYAGIDVRVEPCLTRRARLAAGNLTRLGRTRSRLGTESCLGESVADRNGMFRVVLGPLDRDQYRAFLPGHHGMERLVRLARLYVRSPLSFDVRLRLAAPEVPALRLAPEQGFGLGHMSWLTPRGSEEGTNVFTIHRIDSLS